MLKTLEFIKKYQDDKDLMASLFIKYMKRNFKEKYEDMIKINLPKSFLSNIYTNHFSEEEIKAIEKSLR